MGGCFNTMHAVLPAMIGQRYGQDRQCRGTFGMRGRPAAWPIRPRNGACAASPKASRSSWPAQHHVNYVAPGMVDGPRFRDKVCADMAKKLNITV